MYTEPKLPNPAPVASQLVGTESQVPNPAPCDHTHDITSSTDSEPPLSPPSPSPLSALQKLACEPPRAFAMFVRFAAIVPPPAYAEFSRQTGIHPNTLCRWNKLYRWDDRISSYHTLLQQQFTNAAVTHVERRLDREQEQDERRLDLRANAMKLARLALESWEPDAQPTSIQGVVRALELACKLNPPPASAEDLKNSASERRYAEFMARLDRIYGPQAQENPMAGKPATVVMNGDEK